MRGRAGAACTLAATALLAGAHAPAAERVRGELFGQRIDTTVDGALARYYLEDYLAGARREPAFDRRLDRLHREAPPVTREALAAIAADFSVDVAAAYCAWRLLQDPRNRELQQRFEAELDAVRSGAVRPVPEPPRILMAPGWLWRTQPETGADFARPRAVLRGMGLSSTLLETAESGTIEDNAAIIARGLAQHAQDADAILVSASKAGPEVGWALTRLEAAGTAHRVGAWVNIGGILQGSPLADTATRWPLRWLVRVAALWEPWTYTSIRSMRTAPGRERFAQWHRPPHTAALNFLAVPFSGDVSAGARDNHARMAALGPNDGLTLLADAIAPDSRTIVQLGVDHYYLDPEIDLKTAALARLAFDFARHTGGPR
jgi:hypothetical protein